MTATQSLLEYNYNNDVITLQNEVNQLQIELTMTQHHMVGVKTTNEYLRVRSHLFDSIFERLRQQLAEAIAEAMHAGSTMTHPRRTSANF